MLKNRSLCHIWKSKKMGQGAKGKEKGKESSSQTALMSLKHEGFSLFVVLHTSVRVIVLRSKSRSGKCQGDY